MMKIASTRKIIIFLVASIFLAGCASFPKKGGDHGFKKGGTIAFVAADRKKGSSDLVKVFMEKYSKKDNFSVIPESQITKSFKYYPLEIITNIYTIKKKLTQKDLEAITEVGKRIGGDFICFVGLYSDTGDGGIVLYDVRGNSIISRYTAHYKLEPPDDIFSLIFFSLFGDEEKYYQKKLGEYADLVERKGFSKL